MDTPKRPHNLLRWIIGGALLLAIFGQHLMWNSVSPILSVIVDDLGVGLTEGGTLTSVICIMITLGSLCYDKISPYVSAKGLFLFGLGAIVAAQFLFLIPGDYTGAVGLRVLSGIGMGLLLPTYAALVMSNFSEDERPIVNTIYGAVPYAASILCLGITVPIFNACSGSWRQTMAALGVLMLAFTLIWLFVMPRVRDEEKTESEQASRKGVLGKVARNPQVLLLMAADFFDLWGYNYMASFAPTFFTTECGMSLEQSSQLFAVFPVAGLAAGLLCGFWMSKVGLRKPFTWPMHLLIFGGTLMVAFCDGWLRIAGLFLAGFGNAGWSPALYTIPMEFKGMTQLERSVAYSFIFALGHIAAFASPVVGGWLGELITLKWTMVIFAFAALFAAIACFFLQETGHRRK